MNDTHVYGSGMTGAELLLNKMHIALRRIDTEPAYVIHVKLRNTRFSELYPTKELARLGAKYWRHENDGTVLMRRYHKDATPSPHRKEVTT